MSFLNFLILTFSINLVNGVIYNVNTGLNVELQGAFPNNTFNASCVSASCPALNNPTICSGSSYDLNVTISALTACAKSSSICGIRIEPRPITPVQFSLSQVLEGVPLSGVCYATPDGAYTNVIPTFNVISEDEIELSLPNLAFVGTISCNLTQTLGLGLPPIIFPTANAGFQYNFTYSSSIVINKTINSVEVSKPELAVTGVGFNGLQFPAFPGIPNYLDTFKKLVNGVLGQMGLDTFLGDFYEDLVQSALQVAANKCVH